MSDGRSGNVGGKRPPPSSSSSRFPAPLAPPSRQGKGKRPAQYVLEDVDDDSSESSSGSGALPTQPSLVAGETHTRPLHPAVRMQQMRQQRDAARLSQSMADVSSGTSMQESLFKDFFQSRGGQLSAHSAARAAAQAIVANNEAQKMRQREAAAAALSHGDVSRKEAVMALSANAAAAAQRAAAVSLRQKQQQQLLLQQQQQQQQQQQLQQQQQRALPAAVVAAMRQPPNQQHQQLSMSRAPSSAPMQQQQQAEDNKKVFDTLGTAGVDMRSERLHLNQGFDESSGAELQRTVSAAQVEEEQYSLRLSTLQDRVATKARRFGVVEVSEGVVQLLCLAAQERLKNLVDQLIEASKRRIDLDKNLLPIRVTSEPHQLLKRVKKAEEQERHEETMREKARLLQEAKALRLGKGDEADLDEKHAEQIRKVEDEEKDRQKFADINDAVAQAMGGTASFQFRKKEPSKATTASILSQAARSASFLPPSSVAASGTVSIERRLTLLDCLYVLERDEHLRRTPLLYARYAAIGQRKTAHTKRAMNPTASPGLGDIAQHHSITATAPYEAFDR